jgi:5,10-methylene-tetrahydrofolate dehydrogenase/methenyl tetrahydrofolate cyclohydrolase
MTLYPQELGILFLKDKGVKEVEGVKITPGVPGGVGPMTIAMLLRNTVKSCVRSQAAK